MSEKLETKQKAEEHIRVVPQLDAILAASEENLRRSKEMDEDYKRQEKEREKSRADNLLDFISHVGIDSVKCNDKSELERCLENNLVTQRDIEIAQNAYRRNQANEQLENIREHGIWFITSFDENTKITQYCLENKLFSEIDIEKAQIEHMERRAGDALKELSKDGIISSYIAYGVDHGYFTPTEVEEAIDRYNVNKAKEAFLLLKFSRSEDLDQDALKHGIKLGIYTQENVDERKKTYDEKCLKDQAERAIPNIERVGINAVNPIALQYGLDEGIFTGEEIQAAQSRYEEKSVGKKL